MYIHVTYSSNKCTEKGSLLISHSYALRKTDSICYFEPSFTGPGLKIFFLSGHKVMSLAVLTTGSRPGVLLKLNIGPFYAGKPAFNIFMVDGEDTEVHEEFGSSQIFRRLNPFLPPRLRACPHQLSLNCARCPESCDLECKPDGRIYRYGFVILKGEVQ